MAARPEDEDDEDFPTRFRALLEQLNEEEKDHPLLNDTPERAAFLAEARADMREFEREYGPFSEEIKAQVKAELDAIFERQDRRARMRRSP